MNMNINNKNDTMDAGIELNVTASKSRGGVTMRAIVKLMTTGCLTMPME